ncbi:cystathionine beta-lyase [Spiribacter sp. C176]|uniref:Cystathionine beta-lyase n=1 Tax=Spiribacter salilacus TaxID=2664894 RepID=A0A6N7QSR2_9GAMM|nr:cystathionine beta-lyase [Spiribacter salilacus]MRH78433.1 cystathionine beta-lyase [Spiribacter salilacus]
MKRPLNRDTHIVHLARPPYQDGRRPVNPPVVRASTVDFETLEAMNQARSQAVRGEQSFIYGVRGTPTSFALETLISHLENGAGTKLFSSGLEAIAAVFLGFLKPGDDVLVVDTVYAPVRALLNRFLADRQIQFRFYSPREPDLGALVKPNTRMIYTESPGSVTMELQDVSLVAAAIKDRPDIVIACDNTWSSGFCYRPLEHGADLSIVAGTKYLGGHSDVLMGSVTANEKTLASLNETVGLLGMAVSADDCALVLRGARTLHIRYPAHAQRALAVAQWLEGHDEIVGVLYPPLPSSPDHDLWHSQFEGAAGLFTIELADSKKNNRHVSGFVDHLKLFGIGASWGGFESLALPCDLTGLRSIEDSRHQGSLVRLHIGLEDPRDLIADLDQALAKWAAGVK